MAGDQRDSRRGVQRWGGASPARCIVADSVTAGLVRTGMIRRQAERRQGARWAEATEAVFPVHTGATLSTGAGCTLVNLHIAEGPWEAYMQLHPRAKTVVPTEGEETLCSVSHSSISTWGPHSDDRVRTSNQ